MFAESLRNNQSPIKKTIPTKKKKKQTKETTLNFDSSDKNNSRNNQMIQQFNTNNITDNYFDINIFTSPKDSSE